MLVVDSGRHQAATFDFTEDVMDDFHDALDTAFTAFTASKRCRDDLDFDFLFLEDGPAPPKKTRIEEDAEALLDVRLEDDLDTDQFDVDCSSLMVDFSVFDNEDGLMSTPPRLMGRATSTSTPPLSPRADAPPLSRSLSMMSVLSDDLLDMDTIPDRVDEKDLAPAATKWDVAVGTKRPDVDSRIPMPSAEWFANFQPPSPVATRKAAVEVKFPTISVKRVYVEERSLSTEQKRRHAQWISRRKKCLTGHKGYKCPAKSRAAKNKVRNNGRFDQKK